MTLILTLTCFVQTVALRKISNTKLFSKDSYLKFYSWQNAALLVSSAGAFLLQHSGQAALCSSSLGKFCLSISPSPLQGKPLPRGHRESRVLALPWKHWLLAWKATKKALSQNEQRVLYLDSSIFKWWNETIVNCSYK